MKTLGFGQSVGKVMQMAYVVKDIRESINWWVHDAKTGPWFLLDSFWAEDQIYRGEKSLADVGIAMAFSGSMCIEIIQPKDDHPSVYKETVDQRGYGFHHVGLGLSDVESAIPDYEARGYSLAFGADVPTGGRVAYLEGGEANPGFLELIPVTEGMDATFTRFWRASLDWDGTEPIRSFL